jgi:hypothetical protein
METNNKKPTIDIVQAAGGGGKVKTCTNCSYYAEMCENDDSEYFNLSKPFSADHPFDCKLWRWG